MACSRWRPWVPKSGELIRALDLFQAHSSSGTGPELHPQLPEAGPARDPGRRRGPAGDARSVPGRMMAAGDAARIFTGIAGSYDRVATVLSLGQDPRWRRALVEAIDARPTDRVLDVATGTGMVAQALRDRYGCTVVGLDQSADMLRMAPNARTASTRRSSKDARSACRSLTRRSTTSRSRTCCATSTIRLRRCASSRGS